MKPSSIAVLLACFLAAGCGLDTAGLGDLPHQTGSTGSQHADAGANIGATDASPSPGSAADAQAGDGAIGIDAASAGCGASTCGTGAVCCAEDLGGGKTKTSCAMKCGSGGAVVCDLGGSPCGDGDCALSAKFPGLSVCD